ncbi:MFS transporter [Clavibacter californiensis]|uniref:MFS transporter n=1 Tax=Clavibacter californiensis TaxID=1401995 RepID=A0ABX9NA59_9MICO|nr:MFS transporter [Clavibacter californiensis]
MSYAKRQSRHSTGQTGAGPAADQTPLDNGIPAPAQPSVHSTAFYLLLGSQTLSTVGTQVTSIALPILAAAGLGASSAEIGILVAAQNAAFLFVSLPAGHVIDRISPRVVMIFADILRGGVMAAIAITAVMGTASVLSITILGGVAGIGRVFFELAYHTVTPRLVPRAALIKGNSVLEGVRSSAQLAGPSLGGWVTQVFGAGRAIGLDAVTFIISATALMFLRIPANDAPLVSRPERESIWIGFRTIARHSVLRKLIASSAISNFLFVAASALTVPFLVVDVRLEPSLLGLVLSSGAAAGALGAVCCNTLAARVGHVRALWSVAVVTSPFSIGVAFADSSVGIVLLIAGTAIPAFGQTIYNILQTSYRQLVTRPEVLGKVNAASRFLVMALLPVGGLVGGSLGSILGRSGALLLVGIGLTLATVPLVMLVRDQKPPTLPNVGTVS